MRKKVVAYESANSFVKVYSAGKTRIYPNTLTPVPGEVFQINAPTDTLGESTIYTVNGKSYYAGQTVDFHSSSSTSLERYRSAQYLTESLIAIAQVTKDGEKVTVVTGIPANHYGDKERATSYIRQNLEGTHNISINGSPISFTVETVVVTLQPLASFFFSIMDEHGHHDETMIERFEDSETLVIDIGWGTTDVAVCRGAGLVDYRTLKSSMKNVYELVARQLKERARLDGRKLATHDIELLDLEKQIRTKRIYRFANEEYRVMDLYESALREIASLILLESNAYRGLDRFTTVIFTGGGTTSLTPALMDNFKEENGDIPSNIFIMDGPTAQVANVKGYYVYAKYLLQPTQSPQEQEV